jgi:hypothetical protein
MNTMQPCSTPRAGIAIEFDHLRQQVAGGGQIAIIERLVGRGTYPKNARANRAALPHVITITQWTTLDNP